MRDFHFSIDRGGTFTDVFAEVRSGVVPCPVDGAPCQQLTVVGQDLAYAARVLISCTVADALLCWLCRCLMAEVAARSGGV